MQLVSIVIYFVLTGFPASLSNLTGTWALDRTRSDFGGADAPRHYALLVEQFGAHLDVTVFSDDLDGQRVTYRQCRADDQISGLLLCFTPDGVNETWRVTGDSLSISRFAGRARQKLVLGRCAELE